MSGTQAYGLDQAVPYYVAYVGGRWGEDVCDKPGVFEEHADEAIHVLKRHFSSSKVADFHLVPYWARCLAEVFASSGTASKGWLLRAKNDEVFRDSVRAALALGGYVGLRDHLKAQGAIA